MKKYKIGAGFLSLTLACSLVMPVSAEDYSNTEAWYAKCSQAQTSESGIKACQGFQEYQKNRRQDLQKNIESYNSSIASLQNDTSKMEKLAKEQKDLVANLQTQISEKEKSIELIEKNIEELDDKIEAKESEIEAWNDQIETRMKNEQTTIGTNMIIDLIMGSDSLSDMLRRISGVERITEDDQSQIKKLNKLKKELVLQQDEQKRLDADAKSQKTELESQKKQASELEESYNKLVEEYQKQIAQLEAEKRSAQVDMSSIRDFVISTNFSGTIESVSGFIQPVQGGSKSAGTWAYASGGLHLGLDWAAPVGTSVVAPASGVILYAAAPVGSNSGYLGNWTGYPAGGGNTIQMLCNVNDTLYAVSFFHLSQNIYVSAGQSVSQGQTIALSGNSGNSSGAHTHIEVYNLGSMSVSDAVARFSAGADFAWGTGWSGGSTCEAGSAAPCRERPEKFFS